MSEKEKDVTETSEAEIAVHWGRAILLSIFAVHSPGKYDRSRSLQAFQPGELPELFQGICGSFVLVRVLAYDTGHERRPCWKWFVGGKINASYNCIDRHLGKNKNKLPSTLCPSLRMKRLSISRTRNSM